MGFWYLKTLRMKCGRIEIIFLRKTELKKNYLRNGIRENYFQNQRIKKHKSAIGSKGCMPKGGHAIGGMWGVSPSERVVTMVWR